MSPSSAQSIRKHLTVSAGFIKLMLQQKKLILGIALLTVAAAAAGLYLQRPQFISEAMIMVGRYPNVIRPQEGKWSFLEDPGAMKIELMTHHDFIRNVEVKTEGLVVLKAEGPSPEAARESLSRIIREVTERHDKLFFHVTEYFMQELAILERSLEEFQREYEALSPFARMDERLKADEKMLIFLLRRERDLVHGKIMDKERDILRQRQMLNELYVRATRVVKEPSLPGSVAFKRRAVKYGGLALFAGLSIGLFAAFCEALRLKLNARDGDGTDGSDSTSTA
jgi:uncharacterized protein involved in exopolysaccharide biosynthesis